MKMMVMPSNLAMKIILGNQYWMQIDIRLLMLSISSDKYSILLFNNNLWYASLQRVMMEMTLRLVWLTLRRKCLQSRSQDVRRQDATPWRIFWGDTSLRDVPEWLGNSSLAEELWQAIPYFKDFFYNDFLESLYLRVICMHFNKM